MTYNEIKYHLQNCEDSFTFKYNGCSCGIDPISTDKFEMWYGEESIIVDSVDEVMKIDFFDGKSLENILDDVTDFEY